MSEQLRDIVPLSPRLKTLIPLVARGLVVCLCLCRHVEWYHQGGHKDAEAGHHVARGLPARGSDHEEAPT